MNLIAANDNTITPRFEVVNFKRFEVGKTYWTRSACDHECVFSFEVIKRTAKTVTIREGSKTYRRGITVWDHAETFSPYGHYSMAPVVSAGRQG